MKMTEKPMADLNDNELHLMEELETLKKIELPKAWTTAELLETDFPEPIWVVGDLIPTGLTIIAGPPKIGKSWFVLSLAVRLSTGGSFLNGKVEKQKTLLLTLEDTPRRLNSRLEVIKALPDRENLKIYTEWGRGRTAIQMLKKALIEDEELAVVIIDTLGRIQKPDIDSNSYVDTVEEISRLKSFADRFDVSIILLHHTKKMEVSDYLHSVSGSVGYTATADTMLVLNRTRQAADAILNITGRDISEAEYALSFKDGLWEMEGDASELQKTRERQQIYDLLRYTGRMKAGDIAKETGKKSSVISYLLKVLESENKVHCPEYGHWEATLDDKS